MPQKTVACRRRLAAGQLGVAEPPKNNQIRPGLRSQTEYYTNALSSDRRYSKRKSTRGITDIDDGSKKAKIKPVHNKNVDSIDNDLSSNTNILDTHNFSDNLNILFSNIDGIRSKWNDLAALSASDHLLCLNELNLSAHDSPLLASKLGPNGIACINALDYTSYDRKGKKVKTKRKKKKGYGTAILSKIPEYSQLSCFSKDQEIVHASLELRDCKGLLITGYRSPSSRVDTDIYAFYDTLDSIIMTEKKKRPLDFIIFVGDDNASLSSSSHYSRIAATKMLTIAEKHQMIDMIEHINTRGDRQPDSCFAFFDSEKVEVEVSALNGILKSDHEPLQIKIKKSQIIAQVPKYKTVTRRYQKVRDEELTEIMEESLAIWHEKWTSIFDTITEKKLDKAANEFVETLNKVQARCFTKKTKKVPADSQRLDTNTDMNILQLRAKISKAAWQFKRNRKTETLRKLQSLNIQLKKIVNTAAKRRLQEDMTRQSKLEQMNDGKFWELSGNLLNKSSYQTAVERQLTADQLNVKLDQVDQTFINKDPHYVPNPLAYKLVVASPKKYKLNTSPEFIKETIENMPRIQKFFKKNNCILKDPLSLLLRMIQRTDHFPSAFKTSRCSIIGKPPKERAIFALAPIPKIIETIIKISFDDLKVEDGTFQMAYTKNRGTGCCNLITLQEVEMSDEPSLQTLQDLVKAFNSTKHETIIEQAQSKFGAGKLISSWLTNRSYTFAHESKNQTRGMSANQGVPAGTLIGVECFLLFIATASSLTNKNVLLLWAALYADDTSPLVKVSKLIDFQKALDFAMVWARKNNVRFHLDGEKAPTFIAYLKKDQALHPSASSLNLDGVPFKQVFSEKILGLTRKVRDPDKIPSRNIDKYGYECEWNLVKLKQIAYRFQNIRHTIVPEFMKKLVSAYFVGYMRFSSSVIFSRCSPSHIKTARYYYCMAMAAALGLNTAEALNLSCCKHTSVGEDNSGYKKLLKLTGLPSIREMACRDAQSLIKQTALIRPEWFIKSVPRVSRSQKDGKPRIIGTSKNAKGTILESVFQLSDEFTSVFKPIRDSIAKRKEEVRKDFKERIENVANSTRKNKDLAHLYNDRKISISKLDTPILEDYFLARPLCTKSGVVDYDHLLRTFALNSRSHFNCLDTKDRYNNFKTPRRNISPDEDSDDSSPEASTVTATPKRKRVNDAMLPPSKRRRAILQCDEWVGNRVFCKFCKTRLKLAAPFGSSDSESHLLYECRQIPGKGPLPRTRHNKPLHRMRRLAEIAAVPDPGG